MICTLSDILRYMKIRRSLVYNQQGQAYGDDDFMLSDNAMTYVSTTQCKITGYYSKEYIKDMVCRFKTATALTTKILRIVSVTYNGTDTILTFPSATFENSIVSDFTRLVDDLFIQDCLNRAEREVKTYVNRDIEQTTYTEQFYGIGDTASVALKNIPIVSITSLETVYLSDTPETIATTEYGIMDSNSGLIYSDFEWDSDTIYKVTYSAGYTSATIPDDIKESILELASMTFEKSYRGTNTLGKNGFNASGLNISYKEEPQIFTRLDRYRKVNA